MVPALATDRSEIQQLLFRYAHTFDSGDFDSFAALFAHGTLHLEGVGPPANGVDEVRALLDRRVILYDGTPRTNHLIHNSLIDVADDGASARAVSYVQVLQGMPDGSIQTIATGMYHDEFRHGDSVWHFHHRHTVGSLIGDLKHHLRSLRTA